MEIVTLPSAFFLPIGLKMANDWQKWTRGRTLDGGRLTLIMTQISVFTAVSLQFITLFFSLSQILLTITASFQLIASIGRRPFTAGRQSQHSSTGRKESS